MAQTGWQREFVERSKKGFPIDGIKNDSKMRMEVELRCFELTWNCGSTHAPDFGEVTIVYTPDNLVAETKAVKFYITQYRHRDAFNEELCNRILLDFLYWIKPKKIMVKLAQSPRGGIANTATVMWDSDNPSDVEAWERLKYVPKKEIGRAHV